MDYKVNDLSLSEWGRKEIELAEIEMPGLMSLREKYVTKRPLKDARIMGSLHIRYSGSNRFFVTFGGALPCLR
jgi:adenosylhomocysteinase